MADRQRMARYGVATNDTSCAISDGSILLLRAQNDTKSAIRPTIRNCQTNSKHRSSLARLLRRTNRLADCNVMGRSEAIEQYKLSSIQMLTMNDKQLAGDMVCCSIDAIHGPVIPKGVQASMELQRYIVQHEGSRNTYFVFRFRRINFNPQHVLNFCFSSSSGVLPE